MLSASRGPSGYAKVNLAAPEREVLTRRLGVAHHRFGHAIDRDIGADGVVVADVADVQVLRPGHRPWADGDVFPIDVAGAGDGVSPQIGSGRRHRKDLGRVSRIVVSPQDIGVHPAGDNSRGFVHGGVLNISGLDAGRETGGCAKQTLPIISGGSAIEILRPWYEIQSRQPV